jgi:transposase
MIKTIRVMLIPNNRQRSKLFQYANTARFAYNWALAKEQENYKNGGKFLSDVDLRKEFTKMKQTQEYLVEALPDVLGLYEEDVLSDDRFCKWRESSCSL